MPRQPRGIGSFLAGAAHIVSSGLVISILWVAIVIVVVGGIFDTIQAWDDPWRTLFWIIFAFLIFSLSVRVGRLMALWLQERRASKAPAGETSHVPIDGFGSFPEAHAADAVAGGGALLIEPSASGDGAGVIEATTEELQQLGNALRALSEDMINLFFDFQPTPAMAVPTEKEPELAERYQRDFTHRVVHLYEEARERGFPDPEIERYYLAPNAYHYLAPLAWRFGALAERVLTRANAQ
ncbi:MAG TPA: hypothetical protein VHJ40_05760 [Actinomycetota bacterium]|nr:hypothetical protein [Actinomycetota bacterium]